MVKAKKDLLLEKKIKRVFLTIGLGLIGMIVGFMLGFIIPLMFVILMSGVSGGSDFMGSNIQSLYIQIFMGAGLILFSVIAWIGYTVNVIDGVKKNGER